MGLYVLVQIWLVAPSTIQGLEFGGLNLPNSIGEFVFFVVFVLQGKRMLGKILIKKKEKKLLGKILQITSIWFSFFFIDLLWFFNQVTMSLSLMSFNCLFPICFI